MKIVKFIIDGELELELLITFSTSTVPVRNDIINLTDDDNNNTHTVKVMEVEHFINYAINDKHHDPCAATTKHDYVLHCETITE